MNNGGAKMENQTQKTKKLSFADHSHVRRYLHLKKLNLSSFQIFPLRTLIENIRLINFLI